MAQNADAKRHGDASYKFQSHGVHTYEHVRPLIVAAYASGSDELQKALSIYLSRIKKTSKK